MKPPKNPMPSHGGSYIRSADGTLTRVETIDEIVEPENLPSEEEPAQVQAPELLPVKAAKPVKDN